MTTTSFSKSASYYGYAQRAETWHEVPNVPEDNWDRLRSNDGTSSSTSVFRAGWYEGDSYDRWMNRAFVAFDTSALPDGAVISAAYVRVSGTCTAQNEAGDFCICSGTQPSTVITANYQGHVTTTKYGTWDGSAGAQVMTNDDFTLDATGRAAISKTGYTKFCFRHEDDQDDDYTHMSADDHNYITLTSLTLYVTYHAAETKSLTESMSMGDSISKAIAIIKEESISLTAWIVGHGDNYAKELTGSLTIAATLITSHLRNFSKILTESLIMGVGIKKWVNGILADIWAKVAKTTASWVKGAMTSATWTKTATTEATWSKEEKPLADDPEWS